MGSVHVCWTIKYFSHSLLHCHWQRQVVLLPNRKLTATANAWAVSYPSRLSLYWPLAICDDYLMPEPPRDQATSPLSSPPAQTKQQKQQQQKKQAIAYSATNFVINPSFQPNKFSVKVWWTQRRKLESSPLRERWEGWAWWSWSLSSCSSRRRSRAGRLCHLAPPDQTYTKMLSYTVIVRCNLPGEQSCLSWELWAGGKAVRYLVPNEEIIKGR